MSQCPSSYNCLIIVADLMACVKVSMSHGFSYCLMVSPVTSSDLSCCFMVSQKASKSHVV